MGHQELRRLPLEISRSAQKGGELGNSFMRVVIHTTSVRPAGHAVPSSTHAGPERVKIPLSPAQILSGWGDLNSRPLVPQTSALTKLRHSPYVYGAAILSAGRPSAPGSTSPRGPRTANN